MKLHFVTVAGQNSNLFISPISEIFFIFSKYCMVHPFPSFCNNSVLLYTTDYNIFIKILQNLPSTNKCDYSIFCTVRTVLKKCIRVPCRHKLCDLSYSDVNNWPKMHYSWHHLHRHIIRTLSSVWFGIMICIKHEIFKIQL